MKNTALFLQCLALAVICYQCGPSDGRPKDDRQLARVYNKNLYLSDMDGMLPPGISGEDSTLIIQKFVNTWVRESAMLHEAEKNIPKGLNINKLVENYRASLVKHNYENIVVESLLDSVVSKAELESFYEKNKDQYQLESPIMQCRFIKASLKAPQIGQLEKWWKSNAPSDTAALAAWCKQYAAVHYLKQTAWYKVVDIGAYLPSGLLTVDNVANKKQFVHKDSEFIYLFDLTDLVSKKEIAPLSYIEDQARKVILHKRKTEMLEDLKNKLYEEALRNNGVSIYD